MLEWEINDQEIGCSIPRSLVAPGKQGPADSTATNMMLAAVPESVSIRQYPRNLGRGPIEVREFIFVHQEEK